VLSAIRSAAIYSDVYDWPLSAGGALASQIEIEKLANGPE